MDGGGHSTAIAKHLLPSGMLLGVDWDERVLGRGTEKMAGALGMTQSQLAKKVLIAQGNYADLPEILRKRGLPKADGLLLDLGFSSEQLEGGRGFSFLKDEPLLMTYSDTSEPVHQILRRLSETELANVIYELGGERYSRRIAKAVKEAERKDPIRTSGALAEVVRASLPRGYERGRIDPATRTFQALRMYANHELDNIERGLRNIPEIVKTGGRAVVLTFHSLEDGLVKRIFRELAKEGRAEVLTKKPIGPTDQEIRDNPRARSAKLRSIRVM